MDELAIFREVLTTGAVGGTAAGTQVRLRETGVRAVVLVEGVSDQAAVEALAERLGRDLAAERVAVVPMGGVTNTDRFLRTLGPADGGPKVAVLCDAGEVRFVERGLELAGMGGSRPGGTGCYVCVQDLEDELLRAVGADAAQQLLDAHGDLARFRLFQRQPAQRDRTVERQLRRFLGTTSGRKAAYARRLVEHMDLDRTPAPLAQLLADV
ncbi:ATP-dependent endonuclease [Georgenia subflava]|uniref:ATP-dependent endonuclease n=1 Tax=Georgenia subflava TaxID=1622177 RepID=A0A6N7EH69_9MICO|nr:ATP-dependent endonuclease [Georgenia subflava]MPV36328.1 ATP-dependent endonuclease [Georgenia subflava]